MRRNVVCVIIALLVLAAVLAAFWIGGIVMSRSSSDARAAGEPVDYVVILGCRIDGREPGRCLASRIDTAAEFLKKHPMTMAVCAGGQGSDEEISEAEAISLALQRRGIPPRRILKEDQSRSTYENLFNTKRLLDDRTQGRSYRIALVTNDFHIYRSRRLAEYVGFFNPVAISAPTPTILFYQNFLREICAVVVSWIRYR